MGGSVLRDPIRIVAVALIMAGMALPAGANEKSREAAAEKFAVRLGDQVVLFVREGIKEYSASERADRLSQRLQRLADNPNVEPFKVMVEETDISSDLIVANEILVSVFDADARNFAGRTRNEVATSAARLIERAVAQYRQERSAASLSIGAAKTGATLVVAMLFLWLFQRAFRRVRRIALDRAGRELEKVESKVNRVIRAEQLRWPLLILMRIILAVVWIAAVYLAVSLSLSYFPHTRTVAREIDDLVLAPLAVLGLDVLAALPGLLVVLVIALAARWAIRGNRVFFTQVERKRIRIEGFYPEWARPTQRLVSVVVLIVAVIMAYPYVPGSGSPAFQGIAIFLGLLGSLGATGVVSNLINGLIITYMRSFRVGDLVRIGDTMGVVTESTLIVTRLRTAKNVEISVPNSLVLSGQVINYSVSGKPLLTTQVTIGYDTPWRQVHALMLAAAAASEDVESDPQPFVLQTALDDFYVRYELNFSVSELARLPAIMSRLHQHVQDQFNAHGVQIMSPHFEKNPESPAVVPRDKWYTAPAAAEGAQAPASGTP